MATTTNYGWTTPDDTALVKDGASAIRTLGTSVDTTTKALNPSTTLGDIEYRSSTANTNTRLGIGTTGQILTVAAGVPSWATAAAGGMTLLSTTTLSGSSTTISAINQSHKNLLLVISGININTTSNIFVKPNGSSTITNYVQIINENSIGTQTVGRNASQINLPDSGNNCAGSNANNSWAILINNYANTSHFKPFIISGGWVSASSNACSMDGGGHIITTSAISSIEFNFGSQTASGTVLTYGVS